MLDIGQSHRREYESDADRSEKLVIARSPGRVHYLGEHCELKAGLCLSSTIDKYVFVAISPRKDNSLRFFAANTQERKRSTITNVRYKREDRWSNYIKVAVQVFAELGYVNKGLNITIAGDIPQHIGLASSTALEIASAIALRSFYNAGINDKELIERLIKEREAFFEKPVSPIDYAIIMSARENSFVIVDESARETRLIPVDFNNYKILIMDSKVPRLNIEQELKQRKHDVRRGFEAIFNKYNKNELNVKELGYAELMELLGDLPETVRRRSLFVIQELKRIDEADEALRKQDFQTLSRVTFHSHEGLRDLYEVSCPETDWLVKRAQEIEGFAAARMTGTGFGGCTYAILKEDMVSKYKKRLEDYERIFGFHPIIYEVKPAGKASLVFEKESGEYEYIDNQ